MLKALRKRLIDLASDNRSGAAEILRMAVEIYDQAAAEFEGSPRSVASNDEAQAVLSEISQALLGAHGDMAPLFNLVRVTEQSSLSAGSAAERLYAAARAASRYAEFAGAAADTAARNMAGLIPNGARILTHSRSSTVAAAFRAAHLGGKALELIATESRPICEGRILAQDMAALGIRVSLIADAAVALFMDSVDLIVVGADKVTPEGLTNKIGTYLIALAAREAKKPVYAIADTSKFIAGGASPPRVRHDPDELWPAAPPEIQVANEYFEETPLALLSGIVTEDGVLSPLEAAERAMRQQV